MHKQHIFHTSGNFRVKIFSCVKILHYLIFVDEEERRPMLHSVMSLGFYLHHPGSDSALKNLEEFYFRRCVGVHGVRRCVGL